MLVEFILIHAAGMLGGMLLGSRTSRGKKLASLVGFSAFYLIFIGSFMAIFREWWPLLAFGWLLLGKIGLIFDRNAPTADRMQRLQSSWALGCMAYLGGVFLTLFLPLPRLGLSDAVVAGAKLTGGGHWVDHPHSVVAFGLLYFGFLAWSKMRDLRLPASTLPHAAGVTEKPE